MCHHKVKTLMHENVCSSEETSENHGRISDLHSESEVTGISTIATVTPTANNTTKCTSQCCLNYNEAFQPVSKVVLNTLSSKSRNFLPRWYKEFPWLNICTSRQVVLCLYCCFANHHNLNQFSRREDKAFTEAGFRNWKKAIEKFKSHEKSTTHRDASLAWTAQNAKPTDTQLNFQTDKIKSVRRQGLITQIKGIKYLTRQRIAIRGHDTSEGNLEQLLRTWCTCENDAGIITKWIRTTNILVTIQ